MRGGIVPPAAPVAAGRVHGGVRPAERRRSGRREPRTGRRDRRAEPGRLLASARDHARREGRPIEETREAAGRRPDEDAQRRDLLLVERSAAGDLDAFNRLVELHQDGLFALVARLVPDRDAAHDAVQEAFFSAFRTLGSFRGGSVRSWLNRIAVNAALDAQRARRRRPTVAYPELEDETWQPPAGMEADPEVIALGSERAHALGEALAAISADQRTAIVLFDIEGYDYGAIAELTGVSVGTVKSRIHRGRLALRGLLEPSRELLGR